MSSPHRRPTRRRGPPSVRAARARARAEHMQNTVHDDDRTEDGRTEAAKREDDQVNDHTSIKSAQPPALHF